MNNPLETTLFDEAVKFAVEAHQGTERRAKGYPYIIHPMEAVCIVATMTNDPEMLAAAILHDTVEDTHVTIEQIRERFGERVAMLVEYETAPDSESLTWKEKKAAQVAKLASAPYESKVVAIGDKLSNMRGITLDYMRMKDKVWDLFSAPNGKTDVEWYYSSLANALQDLCETEAYKEFVWLQGEVFG